MNFQNRQQENHCDCLESLLQDMDDHNEDAETILQDIVEYSENWLQDSTPKTEVKEIISSNKLKKTSTNLDEFKEITPSNEFEEILKKMSENMPKLILYVSSLSKSQSAQIILQNDNFLTAVKNHYKK